MCQRALSQSGTYPRLDRPIMMRGLSWGAVRTGASVAATVAASSNQAREKQAASSRNSGQQLKFQAPERLRKKRILRSQGDGSTKTHSRCLLYCVGTALVAGITVTFLVNLPATCSEIQPNAAPIMSEAIVGKIASTGDRPFNRISPAIDAKP